MGKRGFFIVIDGIDGTGKSTQARMLKDYHEKRGKDVVTSFEPTNTSEHGKKFRHAMMHDEKPMTFDEELDLITKDRKWHVENVIEPALHEGKVLILDRYYYSTAAYQGTRGIMDYKTILWMNERFAPVPDTIFILVMDVNKALERIDKDDSRGRSYFEKKERLEAIQSVFLKIHRSNKYNTFKIDASGTMEEVRESILSRL